MTETEIFNKWKNSRDLRAHHPDIYKKVMEWCPDKTSKFPFRLRCLWYLRRIKDYPVCPVCNKDITRTDVQFDVGYVGKHSCCSYSCYSKTNEYREKYKASVIKKFGCEHPMMCKEVKERTHSFNKQHRDEINKKISQTISSKTDEEKREHQLNIEKSVMEKYGVNNVQKVKEIHDKQQKTIEERYGKDYFQTYVPEVSARTSMEKYGASHFMKVKELCENVTQKSRETCLRVYGCESSFGNNAVREKATKTMVEKYGVDNFSKSPNFKNAIRRKRFETIALTEHKSEPLFSMDEYCQHGPYRLYKWKCHKCGSVFESDWISNQYHFTPLCPDCYGSEIVSDREKELHEFLEGIYKGNIVYNSRSVIKPLELDIYIPDKNIAFEFDGLYWHSSQHVFDPLFHLKKTEMCEKAGIRLIHIFEDEWVFKKDIVKSRIMSLLGYNTRHIYARKCKILELDSKCARDFVENNHLQGSVSSMHNYGLEYNGELVSVITFGKLRRSLGSKNVDGTYELLRYCNKTGTRVVGGCSRLLKHFIKTVKPVKVISYCDRRWSDGKLYKSVGFNLSHVSSVNYWYIINNKRVHRFKYRKSELPKLLVKYDPNKTEFQNMDANNHYRIYDCGNYVFEMIPSNE